MNARDEAKSLIAEAIRALSKPKYVTDTTTAADFHDDAAAVLTAIDASPLVLVTREDVDGVLIAPHSDLCAVYVGEMCDCYRARLRSSLEPTQ